MTSHDDGPAGTEEVFRFDGSFIPFLTLAKLQINSIKHNLCPRIKKWFTSLRVAFLFLGEALHWRTHQGCASSHSTCGSLSLPTIFYIF